MSCSLTRRTGACVAIALLAMMAAEAASAGPWTVSADAGVSVGDYVAQDERYAQTFFGPLWMVSGAASRSLGDRVALRFTSGYLRTARSVAVTGDPEAVLPNVRQVVALVPLGIGARVFLAPVRDRQAGPFLELTPALYWTRVTDRRTYDGWDFYTGARIARVERDSWARFLPGFDAAIGLAGRVAPFARAEIAAHGVITAALGDVKVGEWYYDRYDGLRQLAMTAGLAWAP